jgi:RHS repeat-associated protein
VLPFHPPHCYLFDELSSVVGLTDNNGTPVSTYQYDPNGSVTNPWRFAAGYFDSSTGLYKFGTRYYNPGFGRWSQQDPVRGHLADPTSLNRYLYAGDDPVNFTDPSGRDCQGVLWQGIVAVIGIITTAQLIFDAIIGAILSASFFPLAAATLLAGVLAYLIYYGAAYALLNTLDTLVFPACGINFDFGY